MAIIGLCTKRPMFLVSAWRWLAPAGWGGTSRARPTFSCSATDRVIALRSSRMARRRARTSGWVDHVVSGIRPRRGRHHLQFGTLKPAQGKKDKQHGPQHRGGDGDQAVGGDLAPAYQVVSGLEEQPREGRRQPGGVAGDHEPRDHEPEDAPGQRPATLEDRSKRQREREVEEQAQREYREPPQEK